MAVRANTILDAFTAAIAQDWSAGESGLDLSVAGLVSEGVYAHPPQVGPFVSMSFPVVISDAEIRNLSSYGRLLRVDIQMWSTADGDNPTARRQSILKLAHDVAAAIEGTLHDSGGALVAEPISEINTELGTIDGDEQNLAPGYGHAVMAVEVIYQATRGY